jgi:hypothetical protein
MRGQLTALRFICCIFKPAMIQSIQHQYLNDRELGVFP